MHRSRSIKLSFNILQLQNLVKRDPPSYYEEFYEHYQHYQSLLRLFLMRPQDYDKNLEDLVMFLAQVSTCYKEDLKAYPAEIMNVLRQNYATLNSDMRMSFCKALINMRNKNIVDAVDLITLFFILLRCNDKNLRKYLQTHIIADVKNMNVKHKNVKVNSALQNFIFKMLSDHNAVAAKMSLDIMKDLYRRNVWRDAKTVNAIAMACFCKVNKILVSACQFFLGVDEDEEKDSSDSEDEQSAPNIKEVMSSYKVNKKSRKKMKLLKRTKQHIKKSRKKNKAVFEFSAIHLLHDPQGMTEKLLKMLSGMNERYEIKMMIMNLISRLVGVHQLILLNFYPLLIRYIQPHQREVTKILMYAAQAAHECVPPDVMEPVVKTIANNFVCERNADEVMTVGINAIKEICMRCPLAINEDLLHDLSEYRKYKNKNVMMAAKSLIQLFRKINPNMLKRKFKSKPTEATKELDTMEYGALKAKSYIPGSEILPVEPSNGDNSGNPLNDDENDCDGSWINVSHSENESSDDNQDMGENEENGKELEEEEKINNEETQKSPIEAAAEKHSDQDKNTEAKEEFEQISAKEEAAFVPPSSLGDKERAIIISQSRILSQEEFRKLNAAQISKEVTFGKGKKRIIENSNMNDDTTGKEIVSLRDIEKLHKKPKIDKETRLTTVLEGREEKEKFGKKRKKNPFASKTQKQHNKNKAFMMIKHKVRSKQKRSFKDKQIALRNSLLKRKRN